MTVILHRYTIDDFTDIEDGGFKPSALSEKAVGVFIGGFTVDYKILQLNLFYFLLAHRK